MNIVAANANITSRMTEGIGFATTRTQSITQIIQHTTIAVLKQRKGSRTMNKGTLGGFISSEIKTEDINLKDGGTMKKAKFSIACRRKTKDNLSDFIYVTALGKVAEGIINYFEKGKGIIVDYHIQTGSYTDKEGKKIFTEDKIVDSWEFPPVRKADADSPAENTYTEPQHESQAVGQPMPQEQETEFMKIPDQAILDSLPFR